MSTIGGTVLFGTLGRLIADSVGVRAELDRLTRQSASGRVAETFAGLGAAAPEVLDLRPALATRQAWQENIAAASGRMQVAQTSMERIGEIVSTFYAQLPNLNGLNVAAIDSVAANARDALREMAGLLNAQAGGVYVFAGQDSANPPVPNPDDILSTAFFTQISAAVANLSAAGAPATAAATLAIATDNTPGVSPFSAFLSQSAAALQGQGASVPVGDGRREATGLLASTNAFIASTGTSTTGSYMRDVMRALATLGALTSAQEGAGGFHELVADTRESLRGAISALSADAGVLGDTQTHLASMNDRLGRDATALTGQIAAAEDVDMAATLSRLSLVQAQLQSSYQMIASLQQLSLARFLSA